MCLKLQNWYIITLKLVGCSNLQKMKRMNLKALITICLILLSTQVYSQHAHVHGQGKVLIAQDGDDWQLQFVLPAADVLGFEHVPETMEQKQAVESLSGKVGNVPNLVSIDGNCTVANSDVSIPELFTDFSKVEKSSGLASAKHDHDHDTHDHDHHKHDHDHHKHDHDHDHHNDDHNHHKHDHDHHKHDHDHAHEEVHKDIEVNYVVSCTNNVDSMTFAIFDVFSSLEKLDANWISNKSQGAKMLSPDDNSVVFN